MGQSTAPPRAVTLRNFARRPRVPGAPPPQRLHAIDAAWMSVFAVISIVVAYFTGGSGVIAQPQTYLAAVTVVCLYLLGFRVRDRATAVVAAALLATSPLFSATQIGSVRDSLFVLFTISALAAYANAPYATAAELLSVGIAAAATIMRPEGFILGAVLLGFAITDKRPGGIVGLIIYLVVSFAGIAGMAIYTHHPFPLPIPALNLTPLLSLFNTQTVVLSCFIIALLGDFADPPRRSRWKTIILWAVLFVLVETFFRFAGFSFETGPFRPILFLLASGGIARLLPVIAGDFPNPALRYGVAALFVVVIVASRLATEWPIAKSMLAQIARRQPAPIPPVKPAPKTSTIARSTPLSAPHPAVPHPTPKPVQVAKATPSAKPAPGGPKIPAGIAHHYVYVPAGALKPGAHPITSTPSVTTKPVAAPSKPAPKPAIATPPAKPAKPAVPGVPAELVAAAAAAGVPSYYDYHGRRVPRSPWAIKWDIDHKPKPKSVAAKPATKPVAVAKPKPVASTAPKATPKAVAVVPARKPAPAAPVAKKVVKAPAPKPAIKVAAKPAPKPVVKKAAPKPANTLEAQAAAAGVPMYHVVNGRKVPRNIWAIKWDIAHKAGHPSAPAPKPHVNAAASHAPAAKKAAPAPAHVKPHPVAAKPKPAMRRTAKARPVVHRPAAKRWTRRPVQRRHRSIWAIRWEQAHHRRR